MRMKLDIATGTHMYLVVESREVATRCSIRAIYRHMAFSGGSTTYGSTALLTLAWPAYRPARALHARRRHAARVAFLQHGASGVPRSPSPCEAVLQFMRQSLGARTVSHPGREEK